MDKFDLWNALPATISTERLTLRAPDRADIAVMVELANDRAVFEMLARLPHPYTRADAIAFIEQIATGPEKAYVLEHHGAFAGVASLMFHNEQPEIGYWLGRSHWGQGLMSEAVAAILAAARQTGLFPVIIGRALEINPASLRILQKNGFRRTGSHVSDTAHHEGKTTIDLIWEGSR